MKFSPSVREIRQARYPLLELHWNNPAHRRKCAIEAAHQNVLNNAAMDRGMIERGDRFPANWTDQEILDATERMMK